MECRHRPDIGFRECLKHSFTRDGRSYFENLRCRKCGRSIHPEDTKWTFIFVGVIELLLLFALSTAINMICFALRDALLSRGLGAIAKLIAVTVELGLMFLVLKADVAVSTLIKFRHFTKWSPSASEPDSGTEESCEAYEIAWTEKEFQLRSMQDLNR